MWDSGFIPRRSSLAHSLDVCASRWNGVPTTNPGAGVENVEDVEDGVVDGW